MTRFKFMFVFLRKKQTPKSWKLVANSFLQVYYLDLFCLATGHFFIIKNILALHISRKKGLALRDCGLVTSGLYHKNTDLLENVYTPLLLM